MDIFRMPQLLPLVIYRLNYLRLIAYVEHMPLQNQYYPGCRNPVSPVFDWQNK